MSAKIISAFPACGKIRILINGQNIVTEDKKV